MASQFDYFHRRFFRHSAKNLVPWTTKHYAALGAYFGAFAFTGQTAKHWKGVSLALDQGDALGLFGIFLLFCLGGYGIGWLIGWLKAYSEKRRNARNKTLIVRR